MDLSNVKDELFAHYPYRIELHAHSRPVSKCSDVEPEELVDIYHKAGFDGLALTNHFLAPLMERGGIELYLEDYDRAAAQAKKYGMKVYLAAELRFDENINDYLLYGVDRKILEQAAEYFDKGLSAFARDIKDKRSVLIQAHPYRKNIERIDVALLDGIEAWNLHSGHNSNPADSLHLAIKSGKSLRTAGTDYHHPSRQRPTVALRAKNLPEDSFALAALLKSGDFFFDMENESIILP